MVLTLAQQPERHPWIMRWFLLIVVDGEIKNWLFIDSCSRLVDNSTKNAWCWWFSLFWLALTSRWRLNRDYPWLAPSWMLTLTSGWPSITNHRTCLLQPMLIWANFALTAPTKYPWTNNLSRACVRWLRIDECPTIHIQIQSVKDSGKSVCKLQTPTLPSSDLSLDKDFCFSAKRAQQLPYCTQR